MTRRRREEPGRSIGPCISRPVPVSPGGNGDPLMLLNSAELVLSVTVGAGSGAAIGFASVPLLAGARLRLSCRPRPLKRDAAGTSQAPGATSADLPGGIVTLLFTDIEGSTRLLQRHPERYVDLLMEHDGHELGTQGDGFFVVFGRARDAIAAAVDAQRALSDHHWPEGNELRVRMGLHTDEPVVVADTYIGLGVHRAARICAAAHGGQIVLSDATRAHVADQPPADVVLTDLGEQWLKDLNRPERLYQVLAPGLAGEFPRLNAIAQGATARRPPTPGVLGWPAPRSPSPVLIAESRRRQRAFQPGPTS
jgi:class 3 adenylate cyclase